MESTGLIDRLRHRLHRHFLLLLVGTYALAALWPRPGAAIRGMEFVRLETPAGTAAVTAPMALLALLLFNAGLGSATTKLAATLRRPRALFAGALASVAFPLAFLYLLAPLLRGWHDADEARAVLLGLSVVAAMPVASSSAAWSQNAGGCPALSLGLVVISTMLSPLTTPVALAAADPLVAGGQLRPFGPSIGTFVALCVAVPSVAGTAARAALGPDRVGRWRSALKTANALVLLTLCYANASASLPQFAHDPDWDFLALTAAAAASLCAGAFAAGWVLARLLGVTGPQRRSLMFALGMSNNGTGLVLAGNTASAALLPLLTYNLVQHLVAGAVERLLAHRSTAAE